MHQNSEAQTHRNNATSAKRYRQSRLYIYQEAESINFGKLVHFSCKKIGAHNDSCICYTSQYQYVKILFAMYLSLNLISRVFFILHKM